MKQKKHPQYFSTEPRDWEEEANTTASSSQSHFHIRHKRSRQFDYQEKRRWIFNTEVLS